MVSNIIQDHSIIYLGGLIKIFSLYGATREQLVELPLLFTHVQLL